MIMTWCMKITSVTLLAEKNTDFKLAGTHHSTKNTNAWHIIHINGDGQTV